MHLMNTRPSKYRIDSNEAIVLRNFVLSSINDTFNLLPYKTSNETLHL